jgi:hypothetical protein
LEANWGQLGKTKHTKIKGKQMERFRDNLKVRKIKMSNDDIYMVSRIAEQKLRENITYAQLPSAIKDLIKSNILITAATDNMKRQPDQRADIIIGNLQDAITLVMKDVTKASADILT